MDADTRARILQFLPIVDRNCQQYRVSQALVIAQIMQESAFRPDAVSPAGAAGLMQIMPETGSFIAGRLGVRTYSLLDPEDNVRFGVWYLGQQLRLFNGDESLALAAYNAGPGSVQKYRGIPPFPETREYVKRILAYRDEFAKIYGKKAKQVEQLSPHFTRSEVACRCGCGKIGPSPENLKALLAKLEALRSAIGKPIHLTCAYRCPDHNAAVGGVPNSFHTQDMAADTYVDGMSVEELAQAAEKVGFGGIGRYFGAGFVHVDIGPTARWSE